MRSFLLLIALIASGMTLRASPQAADSLLTESGEKKWVHNFKLGKDGQEALRKWVEADRNREVFSTGNYDGFHADLFIQQNKLYVRSLAVDAMSEEKGSYHADLPVIVIFGRKAPVLADWFSGDLYEYYGERIAGTEQKTRVRIYTFERGVLTRVHHKKTSELE